MNYTLVYERKLLRGLQIGPAPEIYGGLFGEKREERG